MMDVFIYLCLLQASIPINDEVFIGGFLVTDRAHPGGLLLVHLDIERGIKTLQV